MMNHDLMVKETNFVRSLIHRILNFFSVNNSIVFGNTFMDGYLSAGSHAVFNRQSIQPLGPGSEHFACQNSGLSQTFKQIVPTIEKMLDNINVVK